VRLQIKWRRVILDEAHNIKDRRCNTAQSAFALSAKYRWCLSGTPLQNRVNELYSLVRFLRIHPYSHYFADKTACVSLDFPFKNDLAQCDLCKGSRMSHYCWWNRRIANPIKFYGYEGRGRTALMILKHQILPQLLLRRTKVECAGDLELPPRRLVLRKDPFDIQEADFYEALYTQSQAAFGGCAATASL
jgi:DNA repair protein RAD16